MDYQTALDILREQSHHPSELSHKEPDYTSLNDIIRMIDPDYQLNAQHDKKRSFHSIEHFSNFGKFGKRSLDSISGVTGFGGLGKRSFDSISAVSNLGGFGKRALGKRGFDSINHFTNFGGLGKRSFDSIEHASLFGGLGKRFYTRGRLSDFGGFGKRSNDNIQDQIKLLHLIESLPPHDRVPTNKRRFDRIGHVKNFGGFWWKTWPGCTK